MSDSTLSISTGTVLLAAPEFNQALLSGKVRGTVKFLDDRDRPRVIFTLVQRTGQRFFIKATQASVIAIAKMLSPETDVMIIGKFFPMNEHGVGVLAENISPLLPSLSATISAVEDGSR